MQLKHLSAALLLAALPALAFAQELAPTPAAAPETATAPAADAATPAAEPASPVSDAPTPGKRLCDMKGKGMMGGMMGGHEMGPGKGCGCPGHPAGCTCGQGASHQDLTQRLDLIEARLAKIEAMLEGLMRR
jgi:hypothetical protein